MVPPLASLVTEVAELGAYSFTAMVNAMGIPTNVAVGSLFGGGYLPGAGPASAVASTGGEVQRRLPFR